MLFFIGVLPVRAEVCLAPSHHGLQDGDEALTEFGKRIFHLRRDFLVDFPMEDIEADLQEAQKMYRRFVGRKVTRTFLTGANPYVLKYDRHIRRRAWGGRGEENRRCME